MYCSKVSTIPLLCLLKLLTSLKSVIIFLEHNLQRLLVDIDDALLLSSVINVEKCNKHPGPTDAGTKNVEN